MVVKGFLAPGYKSISPDMVLVAYVASIVGQKQINLTQIYRVIATDLFLIFFLIMPALIIGTINYNSVADMSVFSRHNQGMSAIITESMISGVDRFHFLTSFYSFLHID